jgi:hypothetical protein
MGRSKSASDVFADLVPVKKSRTTTAATARLGMRWNLTSKIAIAISRADIPRRYRLASKAEEAPVDI